MILRSRLPKCHWPTYRGCKVGDAFIKKRLSRAVGEEQVVRVPKYTVTILPEESCDCGHGSGVCWWNPLAILHALIRPSCTQCTDSP